MGQSMKTAKNFTLKISQYMCDSSHPINTVSKKCDCSIRVFCTLTDMIALLEYIDQLVYPTL